MTTNPVQTYFKKSLKLERGESQPTMTAAEMTALLGIAKKKGFTAAEKRFLSAVFKKALPEEWSKVPKGKYLAKSADLDLFKAKLAENGISVEKPAAYLLTNDTDKNDPRIKLGMYERLLQRGVKSPWLDINALLKPDAKKQLVKQGFVQVPSDSQTTVFELGRGSIGFDGQRAVFYGDGRVGLSSFISGRANVLEIILRMPDGTISNSVQQMP